jgi:deoxyadenosine/deoxycytidine kinase
MNSLNSTEMNTTPGCPLQSRYYILVEGNIAVGKSTFLKRLEQQLGKNAEVFPEPIDNWTNYKGVNLLHEMYKNPAKNSFRFQTFVQLSIGSIQYKLTQAPIKVMERSLNSGRHIFTEAMSRLGHIDPIEYNIIDDWYQWMTQISPPVDEIIYLRTSPEVALKRLNRRHRSAESGVTLEYLTTIHDLHENWLMSGSCDTKIRVIDQNQPLEQSLQTADELAIELKSKIFPYLLRN